MPQFLVFLSSILTKQGADRTRFTQLTLRTASMNKHERAAHWEMLERDLDKIITEETAQRLISPTSVKVIKENIRIFSRLAGEKFDSQRLGDQYGALLAGAIFISQSNTKIRRQK